MTIITRQQLIQIDPRAARSDPRTTDLMNAAFAEFGITEKQDIAAMLGHCAIETGGFTTFVENMNYSSTDRLLKIFPRKFKTAAQALPYIHQPEKLANLVYAGMYGNGDEASGDGWRFRGGGMAQTTFRSEYEPCLLDLFGSKDASPDLIRCPEGAYRAGAWFFRAAKLHSIMQSKGFAGVSQRIAGCTAVPDFTTRLAFFNKAMAVLS